MPASIAEAVKQIPSDAYIYCQIEVIPTTPDKARFKTGYEGFYRDIDAWIERRTKTPCIFNTSALTISRMIFRERDLGLVAPSHTLADIDAALTRIEAKHAL